VACNAAAAGSLAAAGVTLLMTKCAIGIAAALAAALSVMLWRQEETNQQLEREQAARRTPAATVSTPIAPPRAVSIPPALPLQSLQAIEDEILAAAEFAVPLTAEQQERVRLDTIIRKGELDGQFAMLFRQLKLPPGTLDAFRTLLVERNQAIYDASQLAQEEGLVFASAAEEKAVADSALGEIDARIAALIGSDGYAKLREHVDLAFFRRAAEAALADSPTLSDPERDERVRELTRRLHRAAPDYEEMVYQRYGWPGDDPPVVRETITAFLGHAPQPTMTVNPQSLAIDRRMAEIARDALLAGRITMNQLSGSVTPAYKAARERAERGLAP
jgi:hypothetical protein